MFIISHHTPLVTGAWSDINRKRFSRGGIGVLQAECGLHCKETDTFASLEPWRSDTLFTLESSVLSVFLFQAWSTMHQIERTLFWSGSQA
jgi:hypothetical protein